MYRKSCPAPVIAFSGRDHKPVQVKIAELVATCNFRSCFVRRFDGAGMFRNALE